MKACASCGERRRRSGAACCGRRRGPGSVREEIMINVLSKTKTDECQKCIRSPQHHPVPSTAFMHLHILFSAYARTHTPATDSYRNVQTHSSPPCSPPPCSPSLLPPGCCSYGSVPFLCGALPAAHAALAKCDLAECWKRKHLTFCPLVLMCLHRTSSFPEYGLSTVCTPHSL